MHSKQDRWDTRQQVSVRWLRQAKLEVDLVASRQLSSDGGLGYRHLRRETSHAREPSVFASPTVAVHSNFCSQRHDCRSLALSALRIQLTAESMQRAAEGRLVGLGKI